MIINFNCLYLILLTLLFLIRKWLLLGYWLPGYKLESSWATGLHVCVMYNSLASGLTLLEKGAAINRKPNGKTPLHVACEVSNSDFVTLLLSHGAKINSISLSGHTALHYCITKESVECAKQLILKGGIS